MSSFASFNGSGPNWPNREIIGFIAALASISVFLYCFFWSDFWRRIAVSATVIAASGRAVGWLATVHVDIYFRIGATGSLISIAALILIVNTAARRGL